jgi:hypothetical protein
MDTAGQYVKERAALYGVFLHSILYLWMADQELETFFHFGRQLAGKGRFYRHTAYHESTPNVH